MRVALRVASILVVMTGTAKAQDVACGEKWVSFIPYAPNSLDVGGIQFLMRKSDITGGRLLFRIGDGIGVLRVRKGTGHGPSDSLQVSTSTYVLIMQCLLGSPAGAS